MRLFTAFAIVLSVSAMGAGHAHGLGSHDIMRIPAFAIVGAMIIAGALATQGIERPLEVRSANNQPSRPSGDFPNSASNLISGPSSAAPGATPAAAHSADKAKEVPWARWALLAAIGAGVCVWWLFIRTPELKVREWYISASYSGADSHDVVGLDKKLVQDGWVYLVANCQVKGRYPVPIASENEDPIHNERLEFVVGGQTIPADLEGWSNGFPDVACMVKEADVSKGVEIRIVDGCSAPLSPSARVDPSVIEVGPGFFIEQRKPSR